MYRFSTAAACLDCDGTGSFYTQPNHRELHAQKFELKPISPQFARRPAAAVPSIWMHTGAPSMHLDLDLQMMRSSARVDTREHHRFTPRSIFGCFSDLTRRRQHRQPKQSTENTLHITGGPRLSHSGCLALQTLAKPCGRPPHEPSVRCASSSFVIKWGCFVGFAQDQAGVLPCCLQDVD